MSHSLSRAVSSALGRFTAVCGMGTGGTAPLWPPEPQEGEKPHEDEELQSCRFSERRHPKKRSGTTRTTTSTCRVLRYCCTRTRTKKTSSVSTARLQPLLTVDLPPITLLISKRTYPLFPKEGDGTTHLGERFALRCFQRLSRPDIATQRCSWQNNWHTSGRCLPVLSYWRDVPAIVHRL